MDKSIKIINKCVEDLKDDILSFIQLLVQTPSLANDEGDVQEIIYDKLKDMELNPEFIPVMFDDLKDHPAFCDDGFSPDKRKNVIGQWLGKGTGKSLILNGHVDVVPTGSESLWDNSPWSGKIKDGKLYGRGSCDMKAGLASGIFAIFVLQKLGFIPNSTIMVQSVVGEESGGCGTLANIVKGYHADAAMILEPTSLKICPIQSGALTFRLTIYGKATHAAMRWEGISAIEKYSLIHKSIIDFEKERHASFNIKYYQSKDKVAPINIGTLKGGEWHSTVPESVVAEGRLGVFPGESISSARKSFNDFINKVSISDPWLKNNPPKVEWFEGQFESGETDINDSLIKELKKTYYKTTNKDPILEGVTYGSDLRLFTNHANIPSVLFGPGDVKIAHAANENVEIEEVLKSVKTIANMITRWCGGSFG